MHKRFQVFVCARDSDTESLQRDLLRSSAIDKRKVPLTILWNKESASSAFSEAMKISSADFLVFTHCDVYFPERWFDRLEWEVDRLTQLDPNWAVAGFSSLTPDGELVGRCWDTSLAPIRHGIFGKALAEPVPIVTTDELAFVVRRESEAAFDTKLPSFHLYATDIVLSAYRTGRRSYAFDMPLVHNAKAQLKVGADYRASYRYMVRKWRSELPTPTMCGTLTANPILPVFRRLRIAYKAICRPSTYSNIRLEDPEAKSIDLGLDRILVAPMIGV